MTEEEYKAEWQQGLHQTDYNNCRFADDKVKYCNEWLNKYVESWRKGYYEHLITDVCKTKLRIAKDADYRKLCTEWTDKLKATANLTKLGLQDLVIPNINTSETITLDELKNVSFSDNVIIKCNHGSGWNKLIKANSSKLAIENSLASINEWLTLNYAYITGYEAQYEDIKPGFEVQHELVHQPIDYGFWCINGEIVNISMTKKLGKNLEQYLAFVNEDGKVAKQCIGVIPEMSNLSNKFMQIVDSMKEAVIAIAKPFDFVRVDMYHINSKNYFGETTFTPCGGRLMLSTR